MYEHVRARLAAIVTARQADAQIAVARADQAHQQRDSTAAAVTAAQPVVTTAQATADSAQTSLVSAQSALSARQAELVAAQEAVSEWIADGAPDPGEPHHHPTPAYLKRLAELRQAVAHAQAAVTSAQSAVATAQAAAAGAAADLATQQQNLTNAQTAATAAASAVAAADQARQAAEAALAAAQQDVAAIDARAAAFAAAHTPADLTAFGDAEQVEIATLRRRRAGLRADRYAAIVAREQLLAAHDSTIETVAALASALHGWSDSILTDPPQIAVVLDGIVQTARAQRAAEPRADDLPGLTAQLRAALDRLQSTTTLATQERDAASGALQDAIAQIASANSEAP